MPTIEPLKNMENQDVISKVDGYAGVIVLNRPKALNALSLSMIRDITRLLIDWKDDPEIRTIIIQSSSDKAFCAGGDIRSVYEARLRSDEEYMTSIFQEEYLLNYMIHMYPKPYVALMDGLAMGGGMGISIHGSHRIVTERSMLAMPEVNIGFFPDVGSTYFLNRCPGEIGIFLGVLGESITGEDALYAGLATHHLASQDVPEIYRALTMAQSSSEVDDILQDSAGGQIECFLQVHRNLIDRCFCFKTVEEILEALQEESASVVQSWLKGILNKSPTSLKLALALLRRGKSMSLKEILARDFRVSQRCIKDHDFFEGIRALLVDKDRRPVWRPDNLTSVSLEAVERYFSDDF